VRIDRDAALKSAEKFLRQGRLDGAIAEYVRVVTAYPNDWSSVNALGDLYVRAGQNDRAIAQFARVGDHLAREGALPKAAAVYKKILRINPSDPRGTRGLALVTEKQGGGAARKAAAVPADDPDAKVHASRDAQDAVEVQRACGLLVEAADLYEAQGRHADALAAVAEASSIDPANPVFRDRMLRMLIAQGEIMQARYVARVAPELVMVADAFERAGRRAEALDTIADAASFDPDNLALRERVMRQLAESGEFERARRLARTTADLLILAEALNRQDRGADVLDLLADVLERDPQNAAVREQLVSAALTAGDVSRARVAARTSREWLSIAEALRKQERVAEALSAMQEATQRDPHNAALHADFIRACIAASDFTQARAAARTKGEIVDVADALEAGGDVEAALDMRADALRRDPDDPALRLRLIRDYIRAGERERAHALLTLDVAGEDPELITLLARLEFGIGRLEEGRRALSHLITVRSEARNSLVTLSRELSDAHNVEAAYVCTELFADAAIRAGEWDAAAAGVQRFVTGVPHHVNGLLKLVEICVDGSLEKSVSAAQAQLTDAYLAVGQAAEARVVAEDLVLRAPWDRGSVDRLRRALLLVNDGNPDRTIADLLSGEGPFTLEGL
jgi:tetratricopeptide (TPR) repeat protein